jgi:hypothetical protein
VGRTLFDNRHLHTELRRADRADIAARAGADDGKVVSVSHDPLLNLFLEPLVPLIFQN